MGKESNLRDQVFELTRECKRLGLANSQLHAELDNKRAYILSLEGERERVKVVLDYAGVRLFDSGVT